MHPTPYGCAHHVIYISKVRKKKNDAPAKCTHIKIVHPVAKICTLGAICTLGDYVENMNITYPIIIGTLKVCQKP